jgi:tetratricopeptide (TPR) repeat protein
LLPAAAAATEPTPLPVDEGVEYTYLQGDSYFFDLPAPVRGELGRIIDQIRQKRSEHSWTGFGPLLNRGIDLARATGQQENMLLWLLPVRALYHEDRAEDSEALSDFEEAYQVAAKLGDTEKQAVISHHIGLIYSRLHQPAKALDAFLDAYRHAQQDSRRFSILTNLVLQYTRTGNYGKALEYSDKALLLRDVVTVESLRSLYINRSMVFSYLGRPQAQLDALLAARQLIRTDTDPDSESTILSNLSDYYLQQENWAEARRYALDALAVSEKIATPYNRALALGNLGIADSKLGNHEQGLDSLRESLRIFEELHNQTLIIELHRVIAEAHADAGDYQQSLARYKEYKRLSDAHYHGQNRALVSELEERFESARKQRDIELLSAENKLARATIHRQRLVVIVSVIIIALALLIGVLIYNGRRVIKQANLKLIQTNTGLQQALAEVRTLQGMLPICSSCKKIRDDEGYWSQIEKYIADNSDATFTHTCCPDCIRQIYPELADEVLRDVNRAGQSVPTADRDR